MLMQVYERLYEKYGAQEWWPGDSPFEIIVGAILTQNTSWKNVELAINNLKESGVLSVKALHEIAHNELAELIRPAGYYRLKSRRLRNFIDFLYAEYDGSLDDMFAMGLSTLREQLLAIKGIGPETADSILLYAAERPTFVVDTYTARVVKRHGWIEHEAGYYEIKEQFEAELPNDTQLFNEYHALIVHVGKNFCRPKPKCELCPLLDMLPAGGICEPF